MKKLSELPLSFRTLATCLILTLLIGYAVSIIQIYDRSHFDMGQVVRYYRGDEGGENSIFLPQTFATILSVSHVHSLSQPFIFACLGFIFCFTSWSEKRKSSFIAIGFAGSVISNASPWLIRYVSGPMVWLLPFSQVMIAASILTLSFVSLKQLWKKS